ncbi:ankyrin repeat domain-containing protein [Rubripirellula reticaptiva]|uniref:Phosphocholine transferase AnkX n=1 Tax=Rubripirellula reticaptiva TaxID=2528013 RepID=A0A5C6EE09_9BACT|nr:ankyrin repeat domain-containing protein [Rubripirellula reticaptiva]TWU46890.1 Phosphocholine transferase AnkX [Rubripirellula reticaptiva]
MNPTFRCLCLTVAVAVSGFSHAADLYRSAQTGSVRDVAKAIAEGVAPDTPNTYGVTPLSVACTYGRTEVAKVLLAAGADPNKEIAGGETPLMTAARTGDVTIVQMLIDHGAVIDETERSGQTALMWAAAEGNTDVVDTLVRAGAQLGIRTKQGFTAMLFAAREGQIETCQRLVQAGVDVNDVMDPDNTNGRNPRKGSSALLLAVESGHFELALWLVAGGADPNDQRSGYSPLHAITWVRKTDRGDNVQGDPEPRGSGSVPSLQFVRAIADAGADVNAKLKKGSGGKARLNHRGATPFLLAAKTADLPLMKLLWELGADPQLTNVDDCNALMAAAGIGVVAVGEEAGTEPEVLAVIDWLIKLGLDPNHVDANGETVMHGAAYRNYPLAVARLAARGADPLVWDQKNKHGWTPTMIASGKRPGSFKPSPETIAALDHAKNRVNAAR